MGHHTFYGPGSIVNTKMPFTVVTQFLTEDGTDDSALSEIRRLYVQDGRVIENARSYIHGVEGDSINDKFCGAQKFLFNATRRRDNLEGDYNQFSAKGGTQQIGAALERGMVLALSIWDDAGDRMNWLDSIEPTFLPRTMPGVLRGECPIDAGDIEKLREGSPSASVSFTNLRYGPIIKDHRDRLLSSTSPVPANAKVQPRAVDDPSYLDLSAKVAAPNMGRGPLKARVLALTAVFGTVLLVLAAHRHRVRLQISRGGHTRLVDHLEMETFGDAACNPI
jgi:cellulose 1,4-beta-cellobiosidase